MPNVDASGSFAERYGPWAIVTGGSEGVGAAWAAALVDRGVGVVLVARRPEPLEATAEALRARGGAVRTISLEFRHPRGQSEKQGEMSSRRTTGHADTSRIYVQSRGIRP